MATYLNRTPSSASNRKTWTFSTWIKRGIIGTGGILTAGGSGQDQTNFTIRATDAEAQTADRAFSIAVNVGISNAARFEA